MIEIFKDIEGYEGKYQISNLGNVKSLNYNKTGKEKLLRQCKDKSGYVHVILYKKGKITLFLIHRLVAKHFIPNPNKYPEVNHKKEFEKTNNEVDNLEWCTHKYNSNYGTRPKRIAQKYSKKVYQYTKDGEFVKSWNSTHECENEGFSYKHVSACCLGKRKTHKGYVWSYEKLAN